MTVFVPHNVESFIVRGIKFCADDTPEQCLLKLAAVTINEMSHMAALLGTDGTVLVCNRAALAGAGVNQAEVLGKPVWECFWPANPQSQTRLRDAVARAARGEFVR